jgi:hypothetical protein
MRRSGMPTTRKRDSRGSGKHNPKKGSDMKR